MQDFLKKCLFFGVIVLAVLAIPTFMPKDFFTYRVWESIRAGKGYLFNGEFYPNQKIEKTEQGDLAHHSDFAIEKRVTWYTDKLGHRNRQFYKNPDVIVVGHSNIVGTSLDQDEIISERLQSVTSLRCYNISPSDFQEMVNLIEAKQINKPSIVVHGLMERFVAMTRPLRSSDIPSEVYGLRNNEVYLQCAMFWDMLQKQPMLRSIRARMLNQKGNGKQSPVNEKMFFLHGTDVENHSQQAIARHADIIKSYSDYCRENGMEYIFMPVPNKETIYYEWVPLEAQPDYINKLCEALEERGVHTLNLIPLFNRQKSEHLLYHYDDTHWNGYTTALVAKKLKEKLYRTFPAESLKAHRD